MERPVGIEPTWSAWKAEARPLGEGRLVVAGADLRLCPSVSDILQALND